MTGNIQNKKDLSEQIKKYAFKIGFAACGIAGAEKLDKESEKLRKWLDKEMHAGMHYMKNQFEKRSDPRKLVKNAKSVISVLYNYFPEKLLPETSYYIISKYAYGEDYHHVIKEKLKLLLAFIQSKAKTENARVFVDSAPVMDKVWAEKSGLGWIGKNTCLINPRVGSFQFIGEIILDLELEYNKAPIKNRCGNCTQCMDACPTGAIVQPGIIDSRKCLSYHTIEHKSELPKVLKNKFENRIFGCDICQDICPWNRFAKPAEESRFQPKIELLQMTRQNWENLTKEEFNNLFGKSAIQRLQFEGLKRNIDFLKY